VIGSRRAGLALALLFGACGTRSKEEGFEEVAASLGIVARNVSGSPEKAHILESLGGGAAWLDADGDGDLDLFLTNGSRLGGFPPDQEPKPTLYRNDGGRFTDATSESGLGVARWWQGAAAGDADGDGDVDLYVTAIGANALFRNRGPGARPLFEEVGETAGVADPRWGASATFFDADGDGDLDLYVANYLAVSPEEVPSPPTLLDWKGQQVFYGPRGYAGAPDVFYRNAGDGRFSDAGAERGLLPDVSLNGLGVLASDLDADGDLDVYVANDRCRNFLFRNRGDGRFEEVGIYLGVAYGPEGQEHAGMGIDSADPDGDGDLDLFCTNFEDENNDYYRNDGAFFVESSAEAGLKRPSRLLVGWGARFFDADLDGDEDLFVAYGHVYPQADRVPGNAYRLRNHLYRNEGGRFSLAGPEGGPGLEVSGSSRGAAFGDADDDGDVDILVVEIDEWPHLLRNRIEGGNWIRLHLRGARSNRDGFGALVLLEAGGRSQRKECRADGSIFSSNDPRILFGLGEAERADRVEVRWPSGRVDEARGLEARRAYRWAEGQGPVAMR